MMLPLAVVGATWRTAPAHIRSRLAQFTIDAEPFLALRQGGYIFGAACITTCSRTEWLLSSPQAQWAANLLTCALHTHMPELKRTHLHVRSDSSACHYVLRVAAGLDSVAEGEGAVGRQVLQAFDRARKHGLLDMPLRKTRRQIERLIHTRRSHQQQGSSTRGVQSLVREALREADAKAVAVLGRGEFGQVMARALRGARQFQVSVFSRTTVAELFKATRHLDALVVCTSAAQAWLNLPQRKSPAVCIDTGSPAQVKDAPGWTLISLDTLLARPGLQLSTAERQCLEHLVFESANNLCRALLAPESHDVLAAIAAKRDAFLHEELPALLQGLPKAHITKVRKAVGALTHTILQCARGKTS